MTNFCTQHKTCVTCAMCDLHSPHVLQRYIQLHHEFLVTSPDGGGGWKHPHGFSLTLGSEDVMAGPEREYDLRWRNTLETCSPCRVRCATALCCVFQLRHAMGRPSFLSEPAHSAAFRHSTTSWNMIACCLCLTQRRAERTLCCAAVCSAPLCVSAPSSQSAARTSCCWRHCSLAFQYLREHRCQSERATASLVCEFGPSSCFGGQHR